MCIQKRDVPHTNSSLYFFLQLNLFSFLGSHKALIILQQATKTRHPRKSLPMYFCIFFDIQLVLSDSKDYIFISYFTYCYSLEYFLEKWWWNFLANPTLLKQKSKIYRYRSWLNLSTNTSETLLIIENVICLFYDSTYIDFYALYKFVIV